MSVPARSVMSVARSESRIWAVQGIAQFASAIGAMTVAVFALSDPNVALRWPSVAAVVLLGIGLLTGPVVLQSSGRAVHRPALTVAATASLVVIVGGLSRVSYLDSTWPEWAMAAILGAGLLVSPLLRLAAGREVPRPELMLAAVAALALIIHALGDPNVALRWPLVVAAAILGLGLAAGALLSRLGERPISVNAIAAVGALVTVAAGVSRVEYGASRWPWTVTAAILAAGLLAGPVVRVVRGEPGHRSAQFASAVVGLFFAIFALSDEDVALRWPLTVTAFLLALGLLAGPVLALVRGRVLERFAYAASAVASIAVLIAGLSSATFYDSRWPEWVTAAVLAAGLAVASLSRFSGQPSEKVLTERVRELSRTRTGALDVQASELRRIERDLHDGAQARLVALSMKLGRAEDRFGDDSEVGALLREAREDAAAAIRELRELARGIAPPVLTDRGLEAAVRSLAQRSGADVRVSGTLTRRLQASVEIAAYFVVAESLTNAAKHAPGARVEVRFDERGGDLFVEVTDFGPGNADPAGGGLTGLRQRVEALDGSLHITSPAGVGTQIEAVLPCER